MGLHKTFKDAVAKLPHDQVAFEAALIKTIPAMGGTHNKSLYFKKDPDGGYVHPEARLAYLAFKLGGNYAAEFFQQVIDIAMSKGTSP